jgi:pyruvate/2-oxoglutarate dehydrogenase complex dihydrolipoamide dehydrogenase (E3) component
MSVVEPLDEHNQKLLNHTQPSNWTNPDPDGTYNLVVIGAGTAGLVCAAGSAGLGAKVALIERALMGGDCLNYGCVPSNSLIRCATAFADVRDAADYGIENDATPRADFSKVMERMRKLRAQISHVDSAKRFKDLGVDVYLGEGQFTGPGTIEVGGQTLKFKKAVIATGARAAAPPIPGLDSVDYLTNETLFNLTELPPRLSVIGAGPIGCEMAQTFRRFGSEVNLLELADYILVKEDPDAAEVVQSALIKDGVQLLLGIESIVHVSQSDSGIRITYKDKVSGEERFIESDALLVAVGRKPNIDSLNLDAAGVDSDPRTGIPVNDKLQSSNPKIYAAGDVASKYQFTHAADFLARTVIGNALFMGRAKASSLLIPWATYTDPQIAHVGLTEHMAKEQGIEIDTYTQPMEDVDRAILDGETDGLVKIHTAKGKGTIVGATIVARHAGDMIGELVMAMKNGIGLGGVSSVIHPYPTQAEAIRRVGDQYNRTRLTPLVKKLMNSWLTWRRK